MAIYTDKKYINLLSSQLQIFKKKKDDLWTFRCPFCGDSEKNTYKARGYIFFSDNAFLFKCHNCSYSTNLYQLIKKIDLSLYREYVLEKFDNKILTVKNHSIKDEIPISDNLKVIGGLLESVEVLPENHWLIHYINHRKIPKKFWNELYYCPDFMEFVDAICPNHGTKLFADDPRLIIPFYDEKQNLKGFQGRTLSGNKVKYITIKLYNEAIKVYGLNRIKKDQLIQVVEGPIDSMFLPNAVATCDSDLSRAAKYLPKENLILIWDNQYENKDVYRSITRAINDGFSVYIFPKSIKEKDINDLVINGMSIDQVNILIQENTFSGLRATLELNNR